MAAVEPAAKGGAAGTVIEPQCRQPGARVLTPALGQPFDHSRGVGPGIGGAQRVPAHDLRLVREHGDDGAAKELLQVLVVAVVGEAQEAGHRVGVEDVARWRGGEAAVLLLGEHAADVAAAGRVPDAHGGPAAGRHLDTHDVVRQRLQHAHRPRIDGAVRPVAADHGADVPVQQRTAGVGTPVSDVGTLHRVLPQPHRLAGEPRVLGDHRALRRPRRVAALVVQDHLHAEPGGLRHQQARQAEELVGEVADTGREADPRVQHEAAVVGIVKGMELAQQLLLFEIVVQEPEGNRPELPRRCGEGRERLLQIHAVVTRPQHRVVGQVPQSAGFATLARSIHEYRVYGRPGCQADRHEPPLASRCLNSLAAAGRRAGLANQRLPNGAICVTVSR